MAKYKVIDGFDLGSKIAKALDLKHTRRIILDVGMDEAVYLYVEFFGDERLYDIDFNDLKINIDEVGETVPSQDLDLPVTRTKNGYEIWIDVAEDLPIYSGRFRIMYRIEKLMRLECIVEWDSIKNTWAVPDNQKVEFWTNL